MREAKKKINDAFRRYFSPLCLYAMHCFRDKFLESPFNEHLYGYTIYCQGVYTKDNTVFGVK